MRTILSWGKDHPLLVGLGLIFACTWSIDLTLAAQQQGALPAFLPTWLGLFVGYGFVIAAVAATLWSEGRAGVRTLLGRFVIWRVGLRWYGVALMGPVVLVLLAIAVAVLSGAPAPDFSQPFVRVVIGATPALKLWQIALIWLLFEILTNGEEIGWRGYVLPRLLQHHGSITASLLLGILWTLWHLPKFWLGGVNETAHSYPFWLFTVDVVAQAVLYTWLYHHTRGSLLLATLFHAGQNTAFLCLPIGMAVPHGALPFFIAIGLHCLWAVVVIVMGGLTLHQPVSTEAAPSRPVSVLIP